MDFTCAVQEDILDIICLCKVSNGIRYCLRIASVDWLVLLLLLSLCFPTLIKNMMLQNFDTV